MDAEYVAQTFQAKKKKKKPPPNAFFFYMQRLRDDLISTGKLSHNTSMAKMPPIAAPKWNAMSTGEKAYYQNLAKTVKAEARGIPLGEGGPASTETVVQVQVPNVPRVILDSRCVPLATRVDVQEENEARRAQHRQIDRANFLPGKRVCEQFFYFFHFQLLTDLPDADNPVHCRPVELGVVQYSLKSGVKDTFHRFIHPGDIPMGYRYEVERASKVRHKIPVGDFKDARHDYGNLWREAICFINPESKKIVPPIYTEASCVSVARTCLAWLADVAGVPNRLRDAVHELEGLFIDLHNHALQLNESRDAPLSYGYATHLLRTIGFDYELNIRCMFHQGCFDMTDEFGNVDEENSHVTKECSLAIAQKYCFALSNELCSLYDIDVTSKHVPESGEPEPEPESASCFAVVDPYELMLPTSTRGVGDERSVTSPKRSGSTSTERDTRDARQQDYEEEESDEEPSDTVYVRANEISAEEQKDFETSVGIHHSTERASMSRFKVDHPEPSYYNKTPSTEFSGESTMPSSVLERLEKLDLNYFKEQLSAPLPQPKSKPKPQSQPLPLPLPLPPLQPRLSRPLLPRPPTPRPPSQPRFVAPAPALSLTRGLLRGPAASFPRLLPPAMFAPNPRLQAPMPTMPAVPSFSLAGIGRGTPRK